MRAKKKRFPNSIEPNKTLLYGNVRQAVLPNVMGQKPAGAGVCFERKHPTPFCDTGERQCREADICADIQADCIGLDKVLKYWKCILPVTSISFIVYIVTTTANRKPPPQNLELSANRVAGHISRSSRPRLMFLVVHTGLRACGLLHLRTRQGLAAQGNCQLPLQPVPGQSPAVRPCKNGGQR